MYKCNVDLFLFSLIALPQNKAETEDPGMNHKDPSTIQSPRTLQNTDTYTGFNRLEMRRTLLPWRDEDRPNKMKDQLWTLSGTFLSRYIYSGRYIYFSKLHCVLCTYDANCFPSFHCIFLVFVIIVNLFLKREKFKCWNVHGTSSIFMARKLFLHTQIAL